MNYVKKEGRKSWVVTIIAVIIAIAFSAMSIISTASINTNLKVLSVHPFQVSKSIFNLNMAVSGNQIRTERLQKYNSEQDVELVSQAIEELNGNNKEYIDYIVTYYLGSKIDSERLSTLLDNLYVVEELYLKDAAKRTLNENEEFSAHYIEPIYNDITATTNTMLRFVNNTVTRLTGEANKTQTITAIFSLIMALSLILFATLYQRSVTRKIREITYRDFLFKTLSENVDTVFMIFNLEDRHMEYVTDNSLRILGAHSKDLLSEKIDILTFCDQEQISKLKQALGSEIIHTRLQQECWMLNPKTKQNNCIEICILPVLEKSKVTRYIVSLIDQTELKRNQQVLREALLNAQNANEAKSAFLSRMSHEIRTPMNAIIGMATIATTATSNPRKIEDCLTKIMTSSKHLLHLVNDVLDMSKIESGKFTMSNETFVMSEVVENVSTIIYGQANAKNQSYDVVVDMIHDNLIGDELRMNQILLNLLTNAVKYTQVGGKVKLVVKELPIKSNNVVRLSFVVSDNGLGMSEEFLTRLFNPFEQEAHAVGGTGLGLAITKNLVTLSGGKVFVESKLGGGSTFNVEIPFMLSDVVEQVTDKEFGDLKILIADDDQDTCEHTSIVLERLGIRAEWVLSGLEVVERTINAYRANESYDVVFIDWKMPEVDGIEATRRIRKVVGPETLIIIISSFNWQEIEQEARLAGASAFISKPMFQSTIYNTLTRVMKKGKEVVVASVLPTADFTGKRFLVAEDNALNMEIAKELLEMTGALIDCAVDGQEAVKSFENSAKGYYDAILMDIQMPILDGYAATKIIRASSHPNSKSIPILAMTANAFSEDVSAALRAGMNAHIAKPIDLNLLYKILWNVVKTKN